MMKRLGRTKLCWILIAAFATKVLAQPIGAQIDLIGSYTLPVSIAGNGFIGVTTDPAGISGGGMVVERSGGIPVQEATLTPFSDLVRPPHPQKSDLRGRWMRTDVDLGSSAIWLPGDFARIGLGDGGTVTPQIYVRIDRFGAAFRVSAVASAGSTTVFVGNGDETQLRISIAVDAGNTLASVSTIPLNGTGSPTSVNIPLNVVADSASDIGFFVSGEGSVGTRATVRVDRMTTDSISNDLSLYSDWPFVKPLQPMSYRGDMANLSQPVYGFQAFLSMSATPVAATPSLSSGSYTASPFPLWIINPITSTLNLASGTIFGDPPVQTDANLANLAFTATATEGIAELKFRPNTPPTRFTAGANGLVPSALDSNLVIVDGTPPGLSIVQVQQNAVSLPNGGVIGRGLLTVSITAADLGYLGLGSGLAGRPQVSLDYYPFGTSPGDITFSVSSGVGNGFVAQHNFTVLNPSGKAHLLVTVQDNAGNSTTLSWDFLVKIWRLRSP